MARRDHQQVQGKRLNKRVLFAMSAVAAVVFSSAILVRFAAAANDAAASAASQILTNPPPGMSGTVVPEAPLSSDPAQAALIARGRYLTTAGDCQSCHTVSGAPAFSGGYPVDTPFGTVFSPNISSSKKYGIGSWTDQQFWQALHNGIGPGSALLVFPKYLYPVMPYSAYSKLSYQDVMAIKAYLEALPPVETPNRELGIGFPFNQRAGLLAWRILFFRATPMQYDSSWNASQRNGAYLVQALAHCSECHTPRNLAMASENSRYLAGGQIVSQSWYAPNISSSKQYGIGNWSDAELVQYLSGDGDGTHGAPFGPMKEAVDESISRLPASDVQDIVAYLRTVPAQDTPSSAVALAAAPALGAQVYADNCARCHGANGEGVTNNFPNLAHNEAISEGKPSDAISMVLGGFQPWHPNQSAMPAFNNTLSATQIAAVTNYIRTSWGNKGAADATADDVAKLQAVTTQEVALDSGTMQAQLHDGGKVSDFADVSGTFEYEGNRTNCQIDATLKQQGAGDIHLYGSCADQGYRLQGGVTQNGQTSPVALKLNDIMSGNAVTGVILDGALSDGKQLRARINFITPNE